MKRLRVPVFLSTSYPFLIVFGVEFLFILYLVLSHRGVIGHDAFQYFGLQYYFLNNALSAGETAQWMPLMTHGTVSNWWYAVQSSMVQGALLAVAPFSSFLSGANFLPIYYIGILFDLTLLLLGVWLLSRRYFASNLTVLFVCVSALGSVTWFTQPWHNLRFYFALPLILHFIHKLFDKGQWRYFLLAGNLFAIQCCGNLPYYIPLISLIVCAYTCFYIVLFWAVAKGQVAGLLEKWWRALIPVGLVAFSLLTVSTLLTYGTEHIANYNVGRLPDGSVSLDTFLYYGTNSNLRWFELLSRISASLDYSVYFGYIALGFAGLSLFLKRARGLLLVAATALVVLLIANSTPIAALFYYTWPTMKYFRHLSLASTIVRLFLCFVAGFGFEQVFLSPNKSHVSKLRIATFGMVEFSVMLLVFSLSYERALNWIAAAVVGSLHNDIAVIQESYLFRHLAAAAVVSGGAAAFFLALASGRFSLRKLAIVAIAFQALDIYSFKFDLSRIRTVPLTAEQYKINRFEELPYSVRRLSIDYDNHVRARYVPQNHYRPGAEYWTADSYMFTDPPVNRGRADHWLWAFDDFLRAYWEEELRDTSFKTRAFSAYNPFMFPFDKAGALRAGGISEDKIQFFAGAREIPSDRDIAHLLASDSLGGNVLLLSGSGSGEATSDLRNDRLYVPYDVIQYDANNIRIRASGVVAGTWLYYADVWHPSWQVTVNGKPAALRKANLAYKAVRLNEGENVVHFRFHSTPVWMAMTFLNWNSLLWVLMVPCLILRAMFVRDNPEVLKDP